MSTSKVKSLRFYFFTFLLVLAVAFGGYYVYPKSLKLPGGANDCDALAMYTVNLIILKLSGYPKDVIQSMQEQSYKDRPDVAAYKDIDKYITNQVYKLKEAPVEGPDLYAERILQQCRVSNGDLRKIDFIGPESAEDYPARVNIVYSW